MRFNVSDSPPASGSTPRPRIPSLAECSLHAVDEENGLGFHHIVDGRPKESVTLKWDLDHPSDIREYLSLSPVHKLWGCRHVTVSAVGYIIMDCAWDGDLETPSSYEDMEFRAANSGDTFVFNESEFCDQDYFFFEAF